jgi:hypothetical protein
MFGLRAVQAAVAESRALPGVAKRQRPASKLTLQSVGKLVTHTGEPE